MITLVLHDHMTDIKKLLQQKVALKKFFSFVNSLLNSPSTPPSTFQPFLHQIKTPSTGFGLKRNGRLENKLDKLVFPIIFPQFLIRVQDARNLQG
ncbi:unnamed protein product [Rhizophagus irregularis]|nr:unnamed protein product [Rhizophagus irregularis]